MRLRHVKTVALAQIQITQVLHARVPLTIQEQIAKLVSIICLFPKEIIQKYMQSIIWELIFYM